MSTFVPVDPGADQNTFPPELRRRITKALTETHDAQRAIKWSENFRQFSPAGFKSAMKEAYEAAIAQWNASEGH